MIKDTVTLTKKQIRWGLVYGIAALFRLWIGQMLGVWFPGEQGADDALMILYSAFPNYFRGADPSFCMHKELGMPLFLQLVNASGISYPAVISLIWVACALLMAFICVNILNARNVKAGSAVPFAAYIFTLFTPCAFDMFCGTRLYRAGILGPMYLMVFELLFIILLLIFKDPKKKSIITLSVFTAFVFSFTYYVKEDGIWLIPVLLMFAVFWIISCIVTHKDSLLRAFVIAVIPFVVFILVTVAYKGINYKYFGVFETNVRSSGESGKFVEYIYKIDSPDRTNEIWAPKDAIEQAFEVSDTLKAHPELKDAIYTSFWVEGNIDEHPLHGDFLTWTLQDAIYDSGVCSSIKEKEAFFAQVNSELKAAFKDGRLKKCSDRISIVSSIGPKTGREIGEAAVNAFRSYGYHVLLKEYEFGGVVLTSEELEIDGPASIIANWYLIPLRDRSEIGARQFEVKLVKPFVSLIFAIWRIISPIVMVIAFIGVILTVFGKKRDAKGVILSLTALGMLGISYVYSFMIQLFCTQFDGINILAEKMYSIGVVPLILIYDIIGISLFLGFISKCCINGEQ